MELLNILMFILSFFLFKALGCILFYLTCTYHPFEDSSKLAILNANYSIPASISSVNAPFCSLIRKFTSCFSVTSK